MYLRALAKAYAWKIRNYSTTLSNGYLGSRIDEERSEMRYVMRIAEFSESSNLWTQLALPGIPGSMPLWVSFQPNLDCVLRKRCVYGRWMSVSASKRRITWNIVHFSIIYFLRFGADYGWCLIIDFGHLPITSTVEIDPLTVLTRN